MGEKPIEQATSQETVVMFKYSPQGIAGKMLLQPTEQSIQAARQDGYMMPDEYEQWLKEQKD